MNVCLSHSCTFWKFILINSCSYQWKADNSRMQFICASSLCRMWLCDYYYCNYVFSNLCWRIRIALLPWVRCLYADVNLPEVFGGGAWSHEWGFTSRSQSDSEHMWSWNRAAWMTSEPPLDWWGRCSVNSWLYLNMIQLLRATDVSDFFFGVLIISRLLFSSTTATSYCYPSWEFVPSSCLTRQLRDS